MSNPAAFTWVATMLQTVPIPILIEKTLYKMNFILYINSPLAGKPNSLVLEVGAVKTGQEERLVRRQLGRGLLSLHHKKRSH